ncbi:hypothetical protein ACROYT_G043467 [Oculina patagonica]
MASSPVWKVRVNYQAVPTQGEDIIADCDGCRSSCSSDDRPLLSAVTNGKPQQQGKNLKEHSVNNNNREDVWSKRKTGADVRKIVPNLTVTSIDNRVTINVSGMRFETYESTLARLPDSLLGSPIKRAPYYDSIHNEFYFNRNKYVFDSILFYYQSGGPAGGVLVKPDGIAEGEFMEEVRFYQLGKDAECKLGLDVEAWNEHGPCCDVVSADVSNCETCAMKIRKLFEQTKPRETSPLRRVIDIWTIFITIFFIILLCGKTLPSLKEVFVLDQCCDQNKTDTSAKRRELGFFWSFSEKFCISWFTLEYVLRAFSATDKTVYLFSAQGIFDMLSFFPYVMMIIIQVVIPGTETIPLQRILVFLTFFSVFKLTRYSLGLQVLLKTIQTSLQELMLLLVCVAISLVLFSSVIYYCESTDESTTFTSIPATFWFIIVTMTTVGYGDMTPATVAGKIFSALCAVFGVCCVLAIPSTIIVTNFNFFYLKHKAKPKKPKRPKTRMTGLQKWVTRFRSVAL